jgi:hypothetical protein
MYGRNYGSIEQTKKPSICISISSPFHAFLYSDLLPGRQASRKELRKERTPRRVLCVTLTVSVCSLALGVLGSFAVCYKDLADEETTHIATRRRDASEIASSVNCMRILRRP